MDEHNLYQRIDALFVKAPLAPNEQAFIRHTIIERGYSLWFGLLMHSDGKCFVSLKQFDSLNGNYALLYEWDMPAGIKNEIIELCTDLNYACSIPTEFRWVELSFPEYYITYRHNSADEQHFSHTVPQPYDTGSVINEKYQKCFDALLESIERYRKEAKQTLDSLIKIGAPIGNFNFRTITDDF